MLVTLARSTNYKWWVFIAIAAGTFTSVVDQISVAVAIPTISDEFHTDLPTVQWVLVAYTLTISALLLPMGRLSDIVGRKHVYIAGLAIILVGAVLAGVSTSIEFLILAKVVQGLGAAMTQGTAMAMITSIFPRSERGKALGSHMSVVGAGAVAGPALGGLVVGALSWRWIFGLEVPILVVAIAAAWLILDKARFQQAGPQGRFDRVGAALSAGMFLTFLLALANGPRLGWLSPLILGAFVAFGLLLVSFVWWELRNTAPLLEMRLFLSRTFSLGMGAGFLSFLGFSPLSLLMPFYLQRVLGFSPSQVGLMLVPIALCMIVMGPLSGRLSDAYGWRRFKVAGLALSAAGMFYMSTVSETSSFYEPLGAMVLLGLGMGMFNSPNSSSILSTVEPARYGVVSALLNLSRNVATVAGIAIGTAIVTAIMASEGYPPRLDAVSQGADPGLIAAFTTGFQMAALTVGGLLLVGLALSMFKGGQPVEASPPQASPRPGPGPGIEGAPSD